MRWIEALRAAVWSAPMLVLFLGTGVYFTVRSRFFQFRALDALRRRGKTTTDGVSPARSLVTALGACMGTGNIAGVGAALLAGGPGALFWMCVCAFFGMMTSFAETTLAMLYRRRDARGQWLGGAMVVLRDGLGMRKWGGAYALLLTLSSFGVGNLAQVNAAAAAVYAAFPIPKAAVGAVFAVLTALTVFGGVKRISAVAEKAVPLLSGVFLLSAFGAIWMQRANLPHALAAVFRNAWAIRPAAGGILGSALRVGVTRGVFSNEAGLGSTAVIHAAADTDDVVRQGAWGVLEVFLDTVVMCSVTGLVILTSPTSLEAVDGAEAYANALACSFGRGGSVLTAVTLALLGFASLTGWSYCGERGTAYLVGEKGLPVYRALYAAAAFFGSFLPLDAAFALSDVFNAMMAIPNLLAVWLLSGRVFAAIRMYKTNGNGQCFS